MEIKATTEKMLRFLKKNKVVALILLLGLILILLPEGKTENNSINTQETVTEIKKEIPFEERLEEILSQIHGAGRVDVMLTISEGEEIIYQTDDSFSTSGESSNKSADTVTITDAGKNQTGLIRQTKPAIYRGAIVVCQGADNPNVKLAITEAVSKITGIGANCISVLKMK